MVQLYSNMKVQEGFTTEGQPVNWPQPPPRGLFDSTTQHESAPPVQTSPVPSPSIAPPTLQSEMAPVQNHPPTIAPPNNSQIRPIGSQNHYSSNQTVSGHSDLSPQINIFDENSGGNFLGIHFYTASSKKVFILGLLIFSAIPFAITFLGAFFGGVLFEDSVVNYFEDLAGISYFSLGIFLPIAVKKMMASIPLTIESLDKVVILEHEATESTLSKQRMDNLVNFYSEIYCEATGRDKAGIWPTSDPDLLKFKSTLNMMKAAIYILCTFYALMTIYSRFVADSEVMQWHHFEVSPIAWLGRSVSDFLLTAVMGPLVLWPIVLCVMLTYHSLKEIAERKALKYIRFSKDEAGGLGEYGLQSFLNTITLLPYAMVIMGILAQARVTGTDINVGFIAASITYLGLLLFVFFFPLTKASKSMGVLKRDELNFISSKYAGFYDQFKLEMAKDTLDFIALRDLSEAMIHADQVFQGILKQPAVPYSRAIVTRLAASITPVFGVMSGLIAF
jgi:hypothetical protein